MSKNQLIALGTMAGLLLIILLVQQLAKSKPDLERECDLRALAPEGFLVSDVSRVEIFREPKESEKDEAKEEGDEEKEEGEKEDEKKEEKVVLVRGEEGWIVESAYMAPGKKDDIEDLLKKLKDIEGEFRSDDPSVLADYQLTGGGALHVAAYREGDEEAWYHLLVGRKEAHGSSFIRKRGEDTVYTVNVNIASEVGIWGDDDKAPESSHWVDKTVIDLDKEKIERLALTTPDRSFVFERREKKAEEDEEKEEGDEDKGKEKEYEWVLASGGPGTGHEFKKKGVDDILGAVDSFSASDVVDPAKKKEYGLDEPGFRCAVRLEGGKEKVLVAARDKPGEDAYMTVEGRAVVYKVSDWKFDDVFSEAKDLFELEGLDEDEDNVRKMTLVYPSVKLELVREDGKWSVSSPSTGLELKESEAEDLARALAEWKPADYADGEDLEAFGLAEPERKVTFVVVKKEKDEEETREHTIATGAEARGVEGRYCLLDGGKRVWIVGKWDVDKIAPEPKDFFDKDVADIEEDDITGIIVSREDEEITLEREGEDEWKLSAGGTDVKPDEDDVEDFAKRFSPLTASDVDLEGKWSIPGEPTATVTVAWNGDGDEKKPKKLVIRFGAEKDGDRPARIDGKDVTLVFSASTADGLAPALKDLVDLTVADVPSGEIRKVVVERDEDAFELVREGAVWKLFIGDEKKDCDAAAVSKYLGRFSGLEAADVLAGKPDLVPEDASPVVTVTRKDGPEIKLTLGSEKDGKIALRKKDAPLVFLIAKDEASALAPASAGLVKAAEEEEKPEEKKPEAKEAEEDKAEEKKE